MNHLQGVSRLLVHLRQPNIVQRLYNGCATKYTIHTLSMSTQVSRDDEDEALQQMINRVSNPELVKIDHHFAEFSQQQENVSKLLTTLVSFNKQYTYILQNNGFKEIEGYLEKNINKLEPSNIIQSLKDILVLYPDAGSPMVFILETRLTHILPKLTYVQLHTLYEMYKNYTDRELFGEIKVSCLRRWAEVDNSQHLMDLLRDADIVQTKNLHTRVIDLGDKFTAYELGIILLSMQKTKHRSTALVRAVAYHFCRHNLRLSRIKLINMGDALSELRIYDHSLLTKWSKAVMYSHDISSHSEYKPSFEMKLYNSLASIRWQDPELLNVLADFAINNAARLTTQSVNSLLAMCATLDMLPIMLRGLLPWLLNQAQINKEMSMKKPRTYLEVMWNLAVLDALKDSQLQPETIIPTGIVEELKQTTSAEAFPAVCIKLANLHTAIAHSFPEYQQSLSANFLQENNIQLPMKKNRPITMKVMESLTQMLSPQCVQLDVHTSMGYNIDAELFMNNEGKIISPKSDDTNLSICSRIAVKVVEYPDCLQEAKGTIGRYSMLVRHLTQAGYTVIMIPYYEVMDRNTPEKLTQYIQEKLNLKT